MCPQPVAGYLDTFAQQWCQALWEIKDNDEKDSAFKGFCMLIQANPSGISNVRDDELGVWLDACG